MMQDGIDRRQFLTWLVGLPCATLLGPALSIESALAEEPAYEPAQHLYGMTIQTDRCIGCGKCVVACKTENDVPEEPFFFRTWVERYEVMKNEEVRVDSPNGGADGFPQNGDESGLLRSFFVPKLCNHCGNPPCVQVCPVGATFASPDGVVLVDEEYCIGCRYCIQACPYGARFLDPRTKTADKCTFCYHRIRKGLQPACVEICPTQTRVFGDFKVMASPIHRLMRMAHPQVLKPSLNTEPKVYYADLDGEVR